jgi:uncharacterized YccA/Bax inhibitor family protein
LRHSKMKSLSQTIAVLSLFTCSASADEVSAEGVAITVFVLGLLGVFLCMLIIYSTRHARRRSYLSEQSSSNLGSSTDEILMANLGLPNQEGGPETMI